MAKKVAQKEKKVRGPGGHFIEPAGPGGHGKKAAKKKATKKKATKKKAAHFVGSGGPG
jgi:hypothetical protein